MEMERSTVKKIIENKEKILKAGKFKEDEFNKLIDDLSIVELYQKKIIESIEEYGAIDIPRLLSELGTSEKKIDCTVEYLKEFGYLEVYGGSPRFFNSEIKNLKQYGILPNVKIIRDSNLCCGCGLCVSICPVSAIMYSKGTFEIDEAVCIRCGLCYTCCPRSFFPKILDASEEEDLENPKFSEQFNYYREIITARTTNNDITQVAQDGGIVTTLLKMAFNQNLIDGALVVTEGSEPLNPLPVFIERGEDLLKTAGTKYTNSPILKEIYKYRDCKKIAIVGTPCIMKALKKLSFYPLQNPFYDNIAIKIGLLCSESFDYSEITNLLKNEFQSTPSDVKKMDINKGRFLIYNKDGTILDIPIKKIKKYGRLGCNFCEDLTAIHTDISVGSIGSEAGWSTVFIRT
ncbi:MAG: Coenzyme F420 hydrogenase/dehydrogenase, beta subunit C-terminal domain, partial [Promethearchaeota archaeon]